MNIAVATDTQGSAKALPVLLYTLTEHYINLPI